MPTCVLGQKPRFDAPPTASGLPPINGHRQTLVRFVPIPAVTPNGAVGLPHIAFLDTLRLIVRSLLPSAEEQDGLRSGGPQA
jgi:hypothetical protein